MAYTNHNDENKELNEPHTPYHTGAKMKLRIFSSFEKANEADAMDAAMQAPMDRIRDTVQLILRVYGVTEELLEKRRGKLHINIINDRWSPKG